MRLFIATPIYLKDFEYIKETLSPFIRGRWSKQVNLHLTHKFIGEDDPNRWKNINLDIPKEEIQIGGFGIFNKKILYLKAYSPNINIIAKELNVRNFIPHITICRIRDFDKKLFFKLEEIKIVDRVNFEVYLYNSILTPTGAIYKRIYKY